MFRSCLIRLMALAFFFVLAGVAQAQADSTVSPGWDLQTTQPGSSISGLGAVMGVPLGTFDFGGSVGVQNVGSTDTIIHRPNAATVLTPPDTAVIPVELVALQLQSVVPVDFAGNGLDFYFVTLNSGSSSTGTMAITFDVTGNAGTFNSFFDVFFDIHKGALNGPIVFSSDFNVAANGVPWDRTPAPGALIIPGVNGAPAASTAPFFPFWPDEYDAQLPGSSVRIGTTGTPVPLPSTALGGMALIALVTAVRFVRRGRA